MENKQDILIRFGQIVQNLRIERNMSIKELSEKTKIRKVYLEKIEAGKAIGLSTRYVFVFADVFNIEPHELLERL